MALAGAPPSKRWLRPASARPAVRVCDKRQVTRVTQSLPCAPGENCRAPAGSSGSGGGEGAGRLYRPSARGSPGEVRGGGFGPRGTLEPSVGVMSQVLGKPQPQGEDGGDDEEEDELVGLAGYEDGPGSSDAELDSGPEEGGEPAGGALPWGACAGRCGARGSWEPWWGRGEAGLQTVAGIGVGCQAKRGSWRQHACWVAHSCACHSSLP